MRHLSTDRSVQAAEALQNMAVALEKFVQQLEASGILADDTLKDFIPPKSSPKDATELARELVRQKKLTKFQVEEVSKGKGKSLVLGNYVLMEKIGAGGMGQVFKARHRRMDRIVAVKLLPPAMTQDAAAIARFEREVKAAAKISHPNIVAAYDADQANGVHFLVMEFVEGSDLSALVKKNGRFSVEKAVDCVLQAAKGLEAAHKKGIVHRDIKPANLLLDAEGTVKILDMGLARLNGETEAAPQAELTSSGMIMGTVDFMAPEQAMNTKSADARADIYALGCSLYYLLTGKSTYEGDTLMAKLLAHRDQPIPALRANCPDVPEKVETVFRKMVAKKVQDRYPTMAEVIADLERCNTRQDPTIRSQPILHSSSADNGLTICPTLISGSPTKPIGTKKLPISAIGKDQRRWLLIGGGLLGVLILLAALVVKVRTKDGTLIVTVNEPDADVQVLNEEGKVEITRRGQKEPITISVDPGKHRLKVSKDGFTVFGQDFEIEAGAKQPITAKLMPLEEKPAVVGTKPAPAPAETKPISGARPKKPLAFTTPGFDQWVKETAAMPAEKQVEAVSKQLMELNPGFDGKVSPTIQEDAVTGMQFMTNHVTDISPVRALPKLQTLTCQKGEGDFSETLSDLSPLKSMGLTSLNIHFTEVTDLSPLEGMKLNALMCASTRITDLTALRGMPLTHLQIEWTHSSDLSPLEGMPLVSLNFTGTNVSDIAPLRGMPLRDVGLYHTPVSDLSPLRNLPLQQLQLSFQPHWDTEVLRSIKTLMTINEKPVAEFCKTVEDYQAEAKRPLAFEAPGFDAWVKQTAALSAEEQVKAVAKKLVELNPGFDGKVTPTIDGGTVTGLKFVTDQVTDISPVRVLENLSVLEIPGSALGQGKLLNLSPLKGMSLTTLDFYLTRVSDLSPLRGMKLRNLNSSGTFVADLSPLKNMPLEVLRITAQPVADLSPLKGMSLKTLLINLTYVSDLSPLKGMAITELAFAGGVTDFALLKEMPLKTINLDFQPEQHTDLLRSIKTLETINFKPAAEFWKDVEMNKRKTP